MINLHLAISRKWKDNQPWVSLWHKSWKKIFLQVSKNTQHWFKFQIQYYDQSFILNINVFSYELDIYI